MATRTTTTRRATQTPALAPKLWPANTPHNLYAVPASSLEAEFESECERLFEEDDEDGAINISIIEISTTLAPDGSSSSSGRQTHQRHDLHSTDEVLSYIRSRPRSPHQTLASNPSSNNNNNNNSTETSPPTPPSAPKTTLLLLHQTFSWGPLSLTAPLLRALLTHLSISPAFFPVLRQFGSHDSSDHEAAGGFNSLQRSDDDSSFEISYTLKHVEEHRREERNAYDPWSIRQVGVVQSWDARSRESVFVLCNPGEGVLRRLLMLLLPLPLGVDGGEEEMEQDKEEGSEGEDGRCGLEMLDVHRLIFCSVTERWGQYLAHLEKVSKDISKKAVLARVMPSRGFEVHFSDSQRIRDLQDTIIHVSHMLDLNLSVVENLLAPMDLFLFFQPRAHSGRQIRSSLSTLAAQTKLFKCHAEGLPRRLDGSSVLVSSILNAKALETLQGSSRTTAELAALAREDAVKAKQDARTLTTITILGFVYLPASFVATLLGTQYINIRDNAGGQISVTFAREMWIFFILTVVLLVVTAGTWRLWEWRNRLADRAAVEYPEKV